LLPFWVALFHLQQKFSALNSAKEVRKKMAISENPGCYREGWLTFENLHFYNPYKQGFLEGSTLRQQGFYTIFCTNP